MMVDANLVRRKLNKMAEYLGQLEELTKVEGEEFNRNFLYQRSGERLLQLIVEVAIDINNHILVDEGKPAGQDYYSSFLDLVKLDVYPETFAKEIAPSSGLRNIIVHEYEQISMDIVYESIGKAIPIYKNYMKHIMNFLNN